MRNLLRQGACVFLLFIAFGCCGTYKDENTRLKAENARLTSQLSRFTEDTTSLQVQIGKLQQKIATLENEKIDITKKLEAKGQSKKK